ncbi:MAG: hypothetical protein V4725_03860 [Bacteroidota bacterium]|nr:hypothetical protein [Ferruginibacter sp.]
MKFLISCTLLCGFLASTVTVSAQKLKLKDGDLSVLKDQSAINFEFTYDDMAVGKFDTEKEYTDKKVEEYNKKEAGRGDNWVKSWVADRKQQFEPKFIELFTKASDMSESAKAKYTLIFKTHFTEPGFNIGITRKNAKISGDAILVETADKSKVIATISVENALGRTFGGYDFDTGGRIAEAYADAGKALGKFVKK